MHFKLLSCTQTLSLRISIMIRPTTRLARHKCLFDPLCKACKTGAQDIQCHGGWFSNHMWSFLSKVKGHLGPKTKIAQCDILHCSLDTGKCKQTVLNSYKNTCLNTFSWKISKSHFQHWNRLFEPTDSRDVDKIFNRLELSVKKVG